MSAYSPVDCTDLLDTDAPECETCGGSGTEVYFHGPHETLRECEDCRGVGRRHTCPRCEDGVSPDDDTCPSCNGYGALY